MVLVNVTDLFLRNSINIILAKEFLYIKNDTIYQTAFI